MGAALEARRAPLAAVHLVGRPARPRRRCSPGARELATLCRLVLQALLMGGELRAALSGRGGARFGLRSRGWLGWRHRGTVLAAPWPVHRARERRSRPLTNDVLPCKRTRPGGGAARFGLDDRSSRPGRLDERVVWSQLVTIVASIRK